MSCEGYSYQKQTKQKHKILISLIKQKDRAKEELSSSRTSANTGRFQFFAILLVILIIGKKLKPCRKRW